MKYVFILACLFVASCAEVTNISVKSTPDGATVSEASKGGLGTAPLQLTYGKDDCLKTDPCMASFYFHKEGYEDVRIERRIDGGELVVHAYLEEQKAELSVTGYPTFASIDTHFKNKSGDWEKFPLSDKNSISGLLRDGRSCQGEGYCQVRISVFSTGFEPVEKVIKIKRGEKRSVEYALNEYAMIGEITSHPAGVDVYERTLGYLGRTPFQIRLPYDQLVRISPQRKIKLKEPVYLFLKFEKKGLQALEKIAEIGILDETQESTPFFTSAQLIPTEKK